MSKIMMKNVSTATVVVVDPDISFRRVLAPGRAVPLTEEQYENLCFNTGFNNLVRGHYLKIDGVAEGQELIPEKEKVFDTKEIERMLVEGDVTAFAKFIPTAASAEKNSVIKLAVDHKITNNGIVALIKKYCDVDVIQAINMRHLAEEN